MERFAFFQLCEALFQFIERLEHERDEKLYDLERRLIHSLSQRLDPMKQSVADLVELAQEQTQLLTELKGDIDTLEAVVTSDDPETIAAVQVLKDNNTAFAALVHRLSTDVAPKAPPVASPVVGSISPSTPPVAAAGSGPQGLTIIGSGFQPSPTVNVTLPDGTVAAASTVTGTDGTLSAQVDFGGQVGSCTLEVTVGAQSSAPFSFSTAPLVP